MSTCSRPGCTKKLRSNNTTGVCATGCLSPDAPGSARAEGVDTSGDSGSRTGARRPSTTLKQFRLVTRALGFDGEAILEEAARTWLDTVKKAAQW